MHTAFACCAMSPGARHSGGRRQLRPMPLLVSQISASPAAPGTLAPPIRPVRDLDAFCAGSPRRPIRAGTPPVGTATSAFCAAHSGVRLAHSLWRAEIAVPASHDAGAVPHRATCGWLARRPHCYFTGSHRGVILSEGVAMFATPQSKDPFGRMGLRDSGAIMHSRSQHSRLIHRRIPLDTLRAIARSPISR